MEESKKIGATDLFMLLAVLIWAVNFTVIKIALREFTPQGFNGLRLFFASLLLILILLVRREGLYMARSDLWKAVVLGIIGHTAYQLLFIHGLNWTSVSNTSIIMAITPVFIALLSTFSKQERIHWAAWAGIFSSFIGFCFVIARQDRAFPHSLQDLKGDLLIFAGSFFWAVYTVFSKPQLERIAPLKWTSLTLAIGTFFYLPFSLNDMVHIPWKEVSLQGWSGLFYSSLFSIAAAYVIWYASVRRIGNSKTAVYGYIIPVFAVLTAYIFLGERISPIQAAGALIILGGVYLARSGYRFFDRKKKTTLSKTT